MTGRAFEGIGRRGLAAGLGSAAVLGSRPARAQAGPVRIGLITAFGTGQLGGRTVVEAAQMAIDDFGGSLNGRPVELLSADYGGRPDTASVIARRWLDQEGLVAIVPNTISPAALAVLELARQRSVPVLFAGPGSDDLTGKFCTPFSIQFVWDSYSLSHSVVNGLLRQGQKTWFIISVDNVFGQSVENNLTDFVKAGGGTVSGTARHPIGMTDYSSLLAQAQASKASVIALGTTGDDLVNLIKQANEFGIVQGGQRIATTSMNIQDVHALGLATAQGLQMVTPFYEFLNDQTRDWTRRYIARPNTWMPTLIEAGCYDAVTHFLRSAQAAGTVDGAAVMAKMKSMRMNDELVKDVAIREDGQAMRPMYLVQVKKPADSKFPFDYYDVQATIAPQDAWRPLSQSACPLVHAAK